MPIAPAIAAVGAAAASAASTVGAGLAAVGSAVGGMSGLMSGIAVAGGALQAVGAITGSKALSSIGGIASMAGGIGAGIGGMANMVKGLSGAAGAARVGGSISKASQMTQAVSKNNLRPNITSPGAEKALFGPMANNPAAQVGLLNTQGAVQAPMAGGVGAGQSPMGAMSQTGEALPFDQRLHDLMARYDNTSMWGMQALAGASQAYMDYEMMKMAQEPQMARLRFDQQQANITRTNQASVPNLGGAVNQGGFLDQGFVN